MQKEYFGANGEMSIGESERYKLPIGRPGARCDARCHLVLHDRFLLGRP